MTSSPKTRNASRASPSPPQGGNRFLGPVTRWRARRLYRQGDQVWKASPANAPEAIRKLEASWSLIHEPEAALLLASLYDRVNRHADALAVLWRTALDCPDHGTVRLQAAEVVLRHGTPAQVDGFFDDILAIDPKDAFALFVKDLLGHFDAWSDQLVAEMMPTGEGRPPFVVALPVWGQPYSDNCIRFALSSLLSPDNLPALGRTHVPVIAIFTDDETEAFFRAHPMFPKLAAHARVRFIDYGDARTAYQRAMEAHYGSEKRIYSDETLSSYYSRTCKFLLMSGAHYVALHAARRVDARVFCDVADQTLIDGTLPRVAELLERQADAVLFHAVQLPGAALRPILDSRFRSAEGVVAIAPEDGDRVLSDHVPARNFHGSEVPYDMPLRVCWRVGREGLLVHANHYHPIGLRPARFDHPLRLTTDPVDSRFLDRTSLREDRIHLSSDARILCISVDDDPLFEAGSRPAAPLSAEDFALWLWGYWGRLRGYLFRNPLRFGRASADEWRDAEARAAAAIEEILARTDRLEASEVAHRTGFLPPVPAGCSSSSSMPESGPRVRE